MEYRDPKRGLKGQETVRNFLLSRGIKPVKRMPYNWSYDLDVAGDRIEVKTAEYIKKGVSEGWQFAIHRHGKLSDECDFYILRLQKLPWTKAKAIYMLVPSPIKTKTIYIGMLDLLQGKHMDKVLRFNKWIDKKRVK